MFTCIASYHCCIITTLIAVSVAIPTFTETIHLEKLSTVYLPYRYENDVGQFMYPSGAAEQTAYDPASQFIYIVGGDVLHVLDITDVSNPTVIYWQQFINVDLTDVEFCGDHLFVAVDNNSNKENGFINVYRKYNTTTGTLDLMHRITVGSLPDMIYPTSDCLTVVVAVEAEAYHNGSHFVDPEGGVGIIKFTTNAGVNGAYQYRKLDFRKFNNKWQDLVSRGARFIYRENNNTFSNDLEPEYITFNKDESIAYLSLQENNAIAEVDVRTQNITNIHPLGFKNWTNSELDSSDRDQKINIRPWPVMGMYQPDSIKAIHIKGKSYLVTANEGDSKDYSGIPGSGGFNEESRVSDLNISASSIITRWANLNGFSGTLDEDENLGRLKVSKLDGQSGDTYDTLYAYGARSISIIDLDTFERVYDSGGEMERKVAEYENALFNGDGLAEIVSTTKDSRSDDKGPEVEDLAVGEIGDLMLLFVGLERPGFIAIYSIPDGINSIQFESIYTGIPITNDTFEDLYNQRQISEIDPEDIRFISAQDSPNKKHILCSAGALSGTLSIFEIKGLNNDVTSSGVRAVDHVGVSFMGCILIIGTLISSIFG
ncbi:mesenchyme-specific cell surface glycoprotein-like [Ylistrum balloti]|uniref:mesenchyme-specific cell surface glycoprotein-like n=1 Tax=Ylistrum balloti TaxID=509963 RepID=UPI002905A7AD|nr:mesenchyme-specific cell surface glycoprotein-like [Ylistrum balloti]